MIRSSWACKLEGLRAAEDIADTERLADLEEEGGLEMYADAAVDRYEGGEEGGCMSRWTKGRDSQQ